MIFLKPLNKYILYLFILNILLMLIGFMVITLSGLVVPITDILILSAAFSLISLLTITIFLRGQQKDPAGQTLHSLVSISLKFLSDMVLALIWFIVAKKTSLTSLFIFFVIYLTLTIFSVLYILKTLKSKLL